MNTNITGFRLFSEIFASLRPCALDKSSLSIGRVKGPNNSFNQVVS